MADPRVQNLDHFTATQHQKPGSTLRSALDNASAQNYHVCIIGASTAIGKGLATSYAKAGCRALVLASRDLESLNQVAETVRAISPSTDVYVHYCDITSASSVQDLAQFVARALDGRLDVLALNSGYSGPVQLKITDGSPVDDGEWARAFAVNVQGTYHAAHYFVPLLLSSPEGSARAFVVVGSIAGAITRGSIANSKYCISKMAQTRIVEHLGCQYGQEGLFTVAVHPGAVMTETAARSAPEEFKPCKSLSNIPQFHDSEADGRVDLVDDPELCGAFCAWLTRDARSMRWLNGRLVSATWDPEELLSRKEEIVKGDILKYEAKTQYI
ncbi:hypothetical protein PG997_007073 [Apiospora hydei]|uniref:NAD(P)-binding protein n=1 Tax=Apiospora hydei TaxID=1337664 RepID=A0ABR1WQH7_9PEZI